MNSSPVELSSAGQASYSFPTVVTNALGHTEYAQFDYYLGKPVDAEDANGTTSSGYYNDLLDRPTQVIRAANVPSLTNQSTFSYNDSTHVVTVNNDQTNYGDNLLKSESVYDGLGRVSEAHQYENATGYITVKTNYDALGRNYQMSNPYRSGDMVLWTTTAFDALGRVTSVTTPDNALVTTVYSGNTVTVRDQHADQNGQPDQNGRARKSVTDALGRLTNVFEDPGVVNLNYQTTYGYDVLDDLTSVIQGTQPQRTFAYDSLKRLSSATNPESGTVNYDYDSNGNLSHRTDARGVVTTYGYDALNRNISVSYSDGTPWVARYYDGAVNGKGRLWYFYTSLNNTMISHTAIDTYDALGEVKNWRQHFWFNGNWSAGYYMSRNYDLAGHVKLQTYPSGHTVTYNYDIAGRLNDKVPGTQDLQEMAFSGNLGDGTIRKYATAISYDEAGRLTKEKFGTDTPIYHKQHFNIRGQQYDVRASTINDDQNWNRGAIVLYYSSIGGFSGGASNTDNNGNVLRAQTWIPLDDNISGWANYDDWFSYDSLNRMTSITEYPNNGSTASFAQSYIYDRWGNRRIDGNTDKTFGGVNNTQVAVDQNTTNNRVYAPGDPSHNLIDYDGAGNQTKDYYTWNGTRAYDAENRIVSTSNGTTNTYSYDADGYRVKRNLNGIETWQIYDIDGELLGEYAQNGAPANPQKEYGYRNGQLLITAKAAQSQTQNVSWTNAVGVSISGNGLTKTTSTGWGNSGAASTQSITSGDGYMECTASETTKYRMIGLSNGDSNQDYADIDFGIYPGLGGVLRVYEGGVWRGDFGNYTTGDVLRVAVEGGVVKYRKNGALIYTSAVSPTYPLLVDAALYDSSSTISNVVISGNLTQSTQNVSWTNAVGVSATGNSLTKTAGSNWGNAGAVSTQSIVSGDGYVEFTVSESTTYRMIGLSNGDSNQNWDDIDFAIFLYAGGSLQVYEAGASRGTFGTFTTGDVLRVAVEGGLIKYRKNGTLFYTSAVSPTYPLLVDTSLYDSGSTISSVVISGGAGADIEWLVADQLGTPRMIFDKTGSLASTKRHDYLPFGEELAANTGLRTTTQGYNPDVVRQKFTTKERDNETGLDYFLARYYSSTQGRFTSPDEFSGGPDELFDFTGTAEANPTFYADVTHPQSLNKYQYCYNNPLTYIDPDGHQQALTQRIMLEQGYLANLSTAVGSAMDRVESAIASTPQKIAEFRAGVQRALGTDRESMVQDGVKYFGMSRQAAERNADQATGANELLLSMGPMKGVKLEEAAASQLSKRFAVTHGDAIGEGMADLLAVGKNGSRGIVMEVTGAAEKSMTQIRRQLKNGMDYLNNKGVKNVVPYVMVTSERAATRLRQGLGRVRGKAVQIIVGP